jgi:GNAT superfamily N-acetyltransferase
MATLSPATYADRRIAGSCDRMHRCDAIVSRQPVVRFSRYRAAWDETMSLGITIRPFIEEDATSVRELFIVVNRLLAPPEMRNKFESYITRSLIEEVDRIATYYGERNGGFWVALMENKIAGMFGLELVARDALELRRMYVDPSVRRSGIARQMLRYAEAECRRRGIPRLELSTSELQGAALELYRAEGYLLVREETAETSSNKTVGAGIRRYYFEKTF